MNRRNRKHIIVEKLELASYEEYEEYRRKQEIISKILQKDTEEIEDFKDFTWLSGN